MHGRGEGEGGPQSRGREEGRERTQRSGVHVSTHVQGFFELIAADKGLAALRSWFSLLSILVNIPRAYLPGSLPEGNATRICSLHA